MWKILLYFLLVVSLVCPQASFGQATNKFVGEYANFYRAEELMEKDQFSAARRVFREFINSKNDENDPMYIKAHYYEGICALELYNNDAIQLLQKFNTDFPENIYKHTIFFKIALHYYQTKKYVDAIEWFQRTDISELEADLSNEYYFKLGYAHFQLGSFTKARDAFFEVKDSESIYAAPALYYFSHIAYQNKTYQVALDGFLKLVNDETFKQEVPYYITQIYHLQGQFDKVTEYGPLAMESVSKENTPATNQLIGDAYFKTNRFDEAVPYLEAYAERSRVSREDNYQLGYAYFRSTYYDKAIRKFDKVSREKDRLGQIALYNAAESYLKLENKNAARSAFQSASEIDADPKIQEDALFNYAVLSYEMDYNPYNEAIVAFETFLNKFPNSKRRGEVYEYLVNVYASTKKYAEALNSLDRIDNKDIRLKTAYQMIAYNWGIEQYERSQYLYAIMALKRVATYPMDPKLTGQALFWIADAHFMLGQYDEAIKNYRKFLVIPGNAEAQLREIAHYNIAYSYFEQQDYIQAIQEFRTFVQLPSNNDKVRKADAFMRIGDAYFTKQNPDIEKAILNYEQAVALRQQNVDRALFYLAKAYGFLPQTRSKKISTLLDIVNNNPGSTYMVPSIFEIGLSYKYEGRFNDAVRYLNQIIQDFPNNVLVKDALIELGDVRYKQEKFSEAESYFNRVLKEFTLTDEKCKMATKGLQDIFRATRQQQRIAEIAQKYPCADITEDDQEVFFYETANELYLREQYDEAIPEINKYLGVYPNGRFSTQLLSYLADIYFQRGDEGQAIAIYERIIDRPVSSFTEEALVRTSKLLYNNDEFERALPYYEQLESLASTPQVIYNTRVGLMRTNFLMKKYNEAADAATKVLRDNLINEQIEIEANYIAGLAYFREGRFRESIPYLKWTEENTGQERGSEALHTLAEVYFELNDLEEVEKLHQQMMQRKPAYDFWIAKSLLLKVKVLIAKDDLFQAERTVNMIMNNYPDQEDGIIMEADKILAEILQLKETPDVDTQEMNRVIDLQEGGKDE